VSELPDVTRFFHPVLREASLGSRPAQVRLAGRSYVLFRDHTGAPRALVDRCPHRFAPLSKGHVRGDGRLECPYHGWHFDGEGRGVSPSQPSLGKCDVPAMKALTRHGLVWLASPDVPDDRLPSLDWSAEGFEPAGTFTQLFRAPLHVCLDNFSEDEHTPWVHTRLGWRADQVSTIDFEAHNFDDRTEVAYHARQRPSWLAAVLGLRPGDTFHNVWTTRFDPVRTVYEISWTSPSGVMRPFVTRSAIFMVPETADTTRFFVLATMRLVDPRLRPVLPLVKKAALGLAWLEVDDDRRFIPTVAGTPASLRGMRLGRFDKPLVHNHKLLERLYWGRGAGALPVVDDAS
jgi:phenylpropionate dioxygenase-like ring-hydroxylating dioxygenase large terminal subunit